MGFFCEIVVGYKIIWVVGLIVWLDDDYFNIWNGFGGLVVLKGFINVGDKLWLIEI